jgi:hypothetical protein
MADSVAGGVPNVGPPVTPPVGQAGPIQQHEALERATRRVIDARSPAPLARRQIAHTHTRVTSGEATFICCCDSRFRDVDTHYAPERVSASELAREYSAWTGTIRLNRRRCFPTATEQHRG